MVKKASGDVSHVHTTQDLTDHLRLLGRAGHVNGHWFVQLNAKRSQCPAKILLDGEAHTGLEQKVLGRCQLERYNNVQGETNPSLPACG